MAYYIFGTISAIVGVGGLIFGFVAMSRNKKSDDRSEGKEDGATIAELAYIRRGIDSIEHKMEKQENQYIDVIKHLVEVEVSAKQAHKRIDTLEGYHKPNN